MANRTRHEMIGSIPAWAGEPVGDCVGPPPFPVYPRVGGGARMMCCCASHVRGLSPRGRGSRSAAGITQRLVRSIPAWAGEPLCRSVHL